MDLKLENNREEPINIQTPFSHMEFFSFLSPN